LAEPGDAERIAQPHEPGRQRPGQDDVADELAPRKAEDATRLDELGVDAADAGERVR
jgi:hypothetical protein